MLRTRLLTAAAVAAAMTAPAAFAQDAASTPAAGPATTSTQATQNSVIDILKAQGNYTVLLSALDQAQLTQTLASRPQITIFAPNDAAFAALPEAERTRLMDPANAQELRNLLLYHVIVADVTEDQIKGAAGPVETAGGARIQIDGSGEMIKLDGAATASANLDASNGGVFPIDRVLMPNASQAAMGDDDAAGEAAPNSAAPATSANAATPATPATPAAPATPADETSDDEAATPATPAVPATSATPAAPPAGEMTPSATPGRNAPNGQPAAATTTTTNPPVQNPTDGQVDEREDTQNPAPTPN